MLPLAFLLASCGSLSEYPQQFQDGVYGRQSRTVEQVHLYSKEDFAEMAARKIAWQDRDTLKIDLTSKNINVNVNYGNYCPWESCWNRWWWAGFRHGPWYLYFGWDWYYPFYSPWYSPWYGPWYNPWYDPWYGPWGPWGPWGPGPIGPYYPVYPTPVYRDAVYTPQFRTNGGAYNPGRTVHPGTGSTTGRRPGTYSSGSAGYRSATRGTTGTSVISGGSVGPTFRSSSERSYNYSRGFSRSASSPSAGSTSRGYSGGGGSQTRSYSGSGNSGGYSGGYSGGSSYGGGGSFSGGGSSSHSGGGGGGGFHGGGGGRR